MKKFIRFVNIFIIMQPHLRERAAPPCHLLFIIYIGICLHISKKSTTFAPKTLEYYC